MTKIVYHICKEIDDKVIDEFVPRVPTQVFKEEENVTPRICLSETIEGCLSAVPWGGVRLEETTSEFMDKTDQDEYLLHFRVYEFDIGNVLLENIKTSSELVNEGLVMDAEITKEIWVKNQTLVPKKSYIVGLKSYMEEAEDVLSYDYYQYAGENSDVSLYILETTNVFYNLNYDIVSE